MNILRQITFICIALCSTVLMGQNHQKMKANKKTEGKWISLFNGQDLTGWTPKFKGEKLGVNFKDTFRVENGILKVSYDKYGKWNNNFGHLFYKEKFSHYRFRVEYRFVGKQCENGPGWARRNNGIMIHCQTPESMSKSQSFPVSIEVQMLGGFGGKRPNGNLCTPGTHVFYKDKLYTPHILNSKSKTYAGDAWVTLEIEVNGSGKIKHILDGEVVLEYDKPQLDPNDHDAKKLIKDPTNLLIDSGFISIQAESHPCEFRKIEIMPLDK